MIDYSKPLINAEAALKRMYEACLNKDYDTAVKEGFNAMADTKMAVVSVMHLAEVEGKQNGVQ